jgi:hypothetical protein
MKSRAFLLFILITLSVGAVFWIFIGHDLTYEVSSSANGEYTFSHTEDFSMTGRLIITSLVALAAGIGIPFFIQLLQGYLRRFSFSFSVYKTPK